MARLPVNLHFLSFYICKENVPLSEFLWYLIASSSNFSTNAPDYAELVSRHSPPFHVQILVGHRTVLDVSSMPWTSASAGCN